MGAGPDIWSILVAAVGAIIAILVAINGFFIRGTLQELKSDVKKLMGLKVDIAVIKTVLKMRSPDDEDNGKGDCPSA